MVAVKRRHVLRHRHVLTVSVVVLFFVQNENTFASEKVSVALKITLFCFRLLPVFWFALYCIIPRQM